MAIRIDIHRKTRIWKIGNDQGVFYGQFPESQLYKFGKNILGQNVDKDVNINKYLTKVLDSRFHDQIPEIAKAIRNRIVKVYPKIVNKIKVKAKDYDTI